jgi:hypothetical protein
MQNPAWLAGFFLAAYTSSMITIQKVAEMLDAVRTHSLAGKEAVATTDLMYQLRALHDDCRSKNSHRESSGAKNRRRSRRGSYPSLRSVPV